MILIRIVDEKEKKSLPNFRQFIAQLTSYFNAGSDLIKSKTHLTKLVLNQGIYSQVTLIDLNDLSLDLVEVLDIAYELESFEYDKLLFFGYLKVILLNGTDTELEYAVKLMLQYSFIDDLRACMAKDDNFKASLKRIVLYNYPSKRLLKLCDGLLWRLAISVDKKTNSRLSFASSGFTELIDPFGYNFKSFHKLVGKKVFISCENYDVFLCGRMRDELKSFGLEATLNNEDLNGDYSFEKVTQDIIKTDVVLICLSQRYKVSFNTVLI